MSLEKEGGDRGREEAGLLRRQPHFVIKIPREHRVLRKGRGGWECQPLHHPGIVFSWHAGWFVQKELGPGERKGKTNAMTQVTGRSKVGGTIPDLV